MISFRFLILVIIGTCTVSLVAAQEMIQSWKLLPQDVENGNLPLIKKIDPDGLNTPFTETDFEGETPQFVAAIDGQLEIVKYYVNKQEERGEDINPPLTRGRLVGLTPLFAAAAEGRLPVVQYYVEILERKGGSINPALTSGHHNGITPLCIAIFWGRKNVFDYLIEKLQSRCEEINAPLISGDWAGKTPFYIASTEGWKDIFDVYVKIFQSRGDDINPPLASGSVEGWTPLCGAASNDRKDIVDFYITTFENQQKDINPPLMSGINAGITPLHFAAIEGQVEVVDLYIKKLKRLHKDINPAFPSRKGFTPFYFAIFQGREGVVKRYMQEFERQHENNNIVFTYGPNSGDAFMLTVRRCEDVYMDYFDSMRRSDWFNIVKLFVNRGLQLDDSSQLGKAAADLAKNDPQFARYLLMLAPLTQQLLTECYAVRDLLTLGDAASVQKAAEALPRIKKLIQDGAEIGAQGKGGYTPLHCLIGNYDPQTPTVFDEMAKELIKSGEVDLNAFTDNGDSALTIAAKFGNSRIFKYLLAKGADPRIGNNPIIAAIENPKMGFFRSLKMPH